MDSTPEASGSTELFLPRRELWNIMREYQSKKLDEKAEYLKKYLQNQTKCSTPETIRLMKHKVSRFIFDFKTKWEASNRSITRFEAVNEDWLNVSIAFPRSKTSPGRPVRLFEECSERTKRRKTQELRSGTSTEELSYATQMSLRSEGQIDAAKLVTEITTSTPKRASCYIDAFEKNETTQEMSGEEALSMMVEAKLTRNQYNLVRSKDHKRFPSYKIIQSAKRECYPEKSAISVSETKIKVKLQSLLDHTAKRLLHVQKDVLKVLPKQDISNLQLITKWGFDGSGGHSQYKQKFSDDAMDDSQVCLTSLVPVQLIVADNKTIVWKNPYPSSTRYCRPIKIENAKETDQFIRMEKEMMDSEIGELETTTVIVEDGLCVSVKHILLFTMIDGKVCNSVSENKYTLRCYICKATTKNFNDIEKMLQLKESLKDTPTLEFGISSLHAWIRMFECLLHLAYKLPLQKKTIQTTPEENIVAETKKRIQDDFKKLTGLIVDKPKPGFGNSNDGNTARFFFQNKEVSSQITGVDEQILEKFYIILQVINSGLPVDHKKFEEYAISTAKLFVQKYPWYAMPPTVHKILIHGSDIIKKALVPIGQLSEEAQEARNKDIRIFRRDHSRKSSRENTHQDVFNMLLVTSDPIISSLRLLPKKKIKNFSKDALSLLKAPDCPISYPTEEQDHFHEKSEEDESSSDSA